MIATSAIAPVFIDFSDNMCSFLKGGFQVDQQMRGIKRKTDRRTCLFGIRVIGTFVKLEIIRKLFPGYLPCHKQQVVNC